MHPQQYKDRIIADPNIMIGKPIIKGTRITDKGDRFIYEWFIDMRDSFSKMALCNWKKKINLSLFFL